MKYILIFLFFYSAFYAQHISDLLPASAGSCSKSGDAQLYRGNDLFRLIDGGAVVFQEYGFNQVIVQKYVEDDSSIIDVEIYEMNDSSGAYGIFSLFTFETGTRTDFNPNAYAGEDFLIFCKKNYYVTLTAVNPSEKTFQGLLLIAKHIEEKIIASNKPVLAYLFETIDDRIAYVKGSLSLHNLTNLNFRSSLPVQEGIFFEKKGEKYFILKYKDEKSAREYFKEAGKYLKDELDYTKRNNPDGLLYQNKNNYINIMQFSNYLLFVMSNKVNLKNSTITAIKNILNNLTLH